MRGCSSGSSESPRRRNSLFSEKFLDFMWQRELQGEKNIEFFDPDAACSDWSWEEHACFWFIFILKSGSGGNAGLLPAGFFGESSTFSIRHHSMRISDFYMETSSSELPSRFHHNNMKQENASKFSEFILMGFSEEPEMQPLIFMLFLSMYLIAVLGNIVIILATTVPKLLVNIQIHSKIITYEGCITQLYFFIVFVSMDILLLTVMAYDRYVAICHPLHYTVIMNPQFCRLLVLASWISSPVIALLHSLLVLRLSFCTNLEIPNFFCELKQIVQLACSDTLLNNVGMYMAAVILGGGSLICILYSYSKIVSSIRGISSAQGKYKAFSTCASHLSVVSLFYLTVLVEYLSSAVADSSQLSSVGSVIYTVVTPMLNPFIYSLRNNEIKRGLRAFFVNGKRKRQLS
ncbi:olfactory receptor 1571-like [Sorex araneus]|uniref:olfactory receptor 1571-like n=1 Tax=Sorex araneus TaxID=42254 RepID=UPI0024334581|nr:olfactory receptor 1571-like [Sorex araneus]